MTKKFEIQLNFTNQMTTAIASGDKSHNLRIGV